MKTDLKKYALVSIALMFFCFLAILPASAVQVSDSIAEEERNVLIDTIRDTPISTEQYLKIVWPEVYEKTDTLGKSKLASVTKVWKMTEGKRGENDLLITSEHDGPEKSAERQILADVLNDLDISLGQYMQIVWPEFYATMPEDTRQAIANTPKAKSSSTKMLNTENTRALTVVTSTNTPVQDRQFIKYDGSSTARGDTPNYHYVQVYLKNQVDVTVSHTAYGKWDSEHSSAGMMYVSADNMLAWPTSDWHRTYVESYATIGTSSSYGTPVYSQWMKYQ